MPSCRIHVAASKRGTNVSPQAPVDHRQGRNQESLDRYLHRSARASGVQETFERKKDAEAHHDTVRVDVRKGTHVAPSQSPTVAQAADTWLKEVKARNAERSTIEHYERHINLHIVPLHWHTKLAALTHDRVVAFRDELLAELSRPLARKVLVSLKSLLKVSRYSHVATDVRIPRGHKEKPRIEAGRDFPTPAEIARLSAATNNPKQRALFLILAFTGLRASELRGLRWSDIDFASCELHVRQRADEYGVIGPPKSAVRSENNSNRSRCDAACAPGMEDAMPTGRTSFRDSSRQTGGLQIHYGTQLHASPKGGWHCRSEWRAEIYAACPPAFLCVVVHQPQGARRS